MTLPDTDTLETLGGKLQNFAPVADPLTDLDADADNKARCDIAMMTHTAPRTWCRFTAGASTAALVRVARDEQWAAKMGSAGGPTLTRASTGTFELTYPTMVTDELGVSKTLQLRGGWGNSRSLSTAFFVSVIPTAANKLTVYVRDTAGALSDTAGADFDIFGV